jgi:hypothetical protein
MCKKCTKVDNKKNYKKHRDKYLAQKKEYWRLNKDKITEYKQVNKERDRKKINKRKAQRKKEDPIFKLRINLPERVRVFLKQKGHKKSRKTIEIVGIEYDGLYKHLCESFELNYGIPRGYIDWKDVHIDHIIPLSSANSEEAIYKLCHYRNLQLLYAEDNLEKSNKVDWSV